MEKRKGAYLGTVIDDKWWKPYAMVEIARGNGEWWLTDDGFCFHQGPAEEPFVISFESIRWVELANWFAGRWNMNVPILKISWIRDDLALTSGFVVSKNPEEAETLMALLQENFA